MVEKEADITEQLKEEKLLQEIESYNENEINWIDNSFFNTIDKIKAHNKKLLNISGKMFFLASNIDRVNGKPEFFGDNLQNITLLQKFKIQKKNKDGDIEREEIKYFWIDERADKRYDGIPIGYLTKKFKLYKLHQNSEEIILFVPAELGEIKNEISTFEGIKIPMDDFSDMTKNLKVKKLTDIFLVKNVISSVQIMTKENLVNLTKQLKEVNNFSAEEFKETLQTHPNGKVFPLSKEAELLNIAQTLSGKKDGYPLHIQWIGPAGTGKTTILEIKQNLFEEQMGILEGANSTPKSLEPSFKETPADPGFLSKCNRIASVDELFKMVQNQINKERQATGSYLGQLNCLLEQKKRTVASGNNNTCTIQTTCKITFCSNPLTNKSTLHHHIPLIEPSALSRMVNWVQDDAEQALILNKEIVRTPANTYTSIYNYDWQINSEGGLYKYSRNNIDNNTSNKSNINPFLTIFDTCNSFVCDLDESKIKDLVKKSVDLAVEPMKNSVWRPRADHHIFLIIDGLVKYRCLFKDYDATFTPKQEDYDLAETIIIRMVNSWNTDLSPRMGWN